LVFTLTGGPDKDLFDLIAEFGVLSFKVAPDFETPADSDGDNKYVVEVTVTDDGAGNLTDVQTLTINVTNTNEAPVITSNEGGSTAAVGLEEGIQ
ncbi:MAG: cadherin repeat domain-containing protein, partial [Opitutae bacterium]